MRLRNIAVGSVVSGALLFAAPPALAVSPAQEGYSFPAGSVQQELGQSSPSSASNGATQESESGNGGTAATPAAHSSSKLPFTGMDIGLALGGGLLLLGFGASVGLLNRRTSTEPR
jgi:hypothetical protein